ncbi:hypothetical protein [Streptomyces sp. MP131-18]|uniref:hypothetical protein n=1 Tax=Streptomyces sp. MP131-18 TaxID=1857892 RepID=UPI00097C0AE6|nr:hypothetical protein [Streptomyces sp. MP131-18]ONK09493.1 helix-turn-helix protein [Streptomyces sp. MP131-18]
MTTTAQRAPRNKGFRSPLAPHGTTARAKGRPQQGISGCGCDRCAAAARRYDKWRRLRNGTGDTLTVPAAPAAEHLRALMADGAGWTQIRTALNCSTSTISNILNGTTPRVRRATADKILALELTTVLAGRRTTDATGSIRRVRALQAAGHTCKIIGDTAGVDHTVIHALVNARTAEVSRSVADRITTAYDQLATAPGSNVRAVNRAARGGWPDPTWWEDWGGIDDPDAPESEPAGATPRYLAVAEDAEWLERQGYTRTQAAERLGVTRDGVQKAISRARKRQQREAA